MDEHHERRKEPCKKLMAYTTVGEDSQTYQIGFELIDVKPEQREILQAILDRYHFRHKL